MKNFTAAFFSCLILFTSSLPTYATEMVESSIFASEQLYQEAVKAYTQQNNKGAIILYQEILSTPDNIPYKEKAHLGLIDAQIAEKSFREAQIEITNFIREYPKSDYYHYILTLQTRLSVDTAVNTNTGWVSLHSLARIGVGVGATLGCLFIWAQK